MSEIRRFEGIARLDSRSKVQATKVVSYRARVQKENRRIECLKFEGSNSLPREGSSLEWHPAHCIVPLYLHIVPL